MENTTKHPKKETQSRHGTLNLYNLVGEEPGSARMYLPLLALTFSCVWTYTRSNLVQNLPYPAGIYDLHFRPGTPIFAISTTTGAISIFKIIEYPQNKFYIEHIKTHQVFHEEIIVTSLAWYPSSKEFTSGGTRQTGPLLAATSSEGTVALVRFKDHECLTSDVLSDDMEMPVHERYGSAQYAYCCAWSKDILFTGGDDSYLRMVRSLVLEIEVNVD